MEPVTIAFLFIIGVVMGEENRAQDAVIESQSAQLELAIDRLNRLAVSHSAVAAREITNHEMQKREIDAIVRNALSE